MQMNLLTENKIIIIFWGKGGAISGGESVSLKSGSSSNALFLNWGCSYMGVFKKSDKCGLYIIYKHELFMMK